MDVLISLAQIELNPSVIHLDKSGCTYNMSYYDAHSQYFNKNFIKNLWTSTDNKKKNKKSVEIICRLY